MYISYTAWYDGTNDKLKESTMRNAPADTIEVLGYGESPEGETPMNPQYLVILLSWTLSAAAVALATVLRAQQVIEQTGFLG